MADVRMKLLPPWSIMIKKIEALFDGDPMIACNVDYFKPSITLACGDGDKTAALQRILPDSIAIGSINLKIIVDGVPTNRGFTSRKEMFDVAFSKNPVYAYSLCPAEEGYQWLSFTYVVFKNCVVQIPADNLNDCHGVISTLYQDIAEEILTGPGAENCLFNTDVEVANLGVAPEKWL